MSLKIATSVRRHRQFSFLRGMAASVTWRVQFVRVMIIRAQYLASILGPLNFS